MTLQRLPGEYQIPKFHGPANYRTYDDNYLLLFKPTPKGDPIVEGEEGTFELKNKEDIPLLFKRKYNWTFSRLNEWECFFRFFNQEELFKFQYTGILEFGSYKLHWIIGTDKMRLTKGNDTKTSKFLTNLTHWCDKTFQVDSLDILKQVVDKYIELNSIIPLNMMSPGSTGKDLLLDQGRNEFSIYNRLPFEDTRFLHTCYVGPRMESRCLGTIDGVENMDLQRAYLRALGKVPSMAKGHLLKRVRGGPFHADAHPGSGYEVEVEVPKAYGKFAPLPLKWQGTIPYPQGKFKTRIPKPYMDLIIERGDIPFKILDSVQILLYGSLYYPFKDFAQKLELFQNGFKEYFYPLNLKALHYPLQGHMLHIHKNFDLDNGRIWYEAGTDYNPADAGAIQSMVACEIFNRAIGEDVEAIRVDAVSGYDLKKNKNYRTESKGLMTFLTPGLKDKPGSTLYRDMIYTWRDYHEVIVKFPMRYGVKKSWSHPKRIGALVTMEQDIYPAAGNRSIGQYLGIKRLGDLLDRRIEISIPEIPSEGGGLTQPPDKEAPYWMDDYLHLFPEQSLGNLSESYSGLLLRAQKVIRGY